MTLKTISAPSVSYFSLRKFSEVVRFLTLVDFLMNGGFGLISPIFAVFVMENIGNANVEVAGIAVTVFLLTKCLLQIIVGSIIDKIRGEQDDFIFLFFGGIFYSLIPLFYIFIETPMQLYAVQFIYGVAAAFAYPSWMAIFTRHIDHEHEGVEWSIYATMVEFGMAIAASLGGFIAFRFGFVFLFVVASVIILISNIFIWMIYNKIRKSSDNKHKKHGKKP